MRGLIGCSLDAAREAERPVAFYSNAIGDTFLTLPALRALAASFQGRLTLICDPWMVDLCFSELPLLRTIQAVISSPVSTAKEFDVGKVIGEVSGTDVFFCLANWTSESLRECIERLAPRVTVGFSPGFDVILPNGQDQHAADTAFQVPRYIDATLQLGDFASPPRLPPDAVQTACRLRRLLAGSSRVLVAHADTRLDKMWSADYFVEVLNGFLERHTDFVVLVVGRLPQPLKRGNLRSRIIYCYGLPLAASCALVGQSDLFVGVDSCMLHVADFYRVPGVGLFGPTTPQRWGFRLGPHRHVSSRDGSMERIVPRAVSQALEELWDATFSPERVASRRRPPSDPSGTPARSLVRH